MLIQWKTSLDSGQFPFEASIITFFGQFPVKTRRGNFQPVRKRDQVFNIEYRSYLFTDQLAIEVRNARRFVDEDSQERALARPFEFRINQVISLTFYDFLNEPPNPVPFDSFAHTTKKWARTPTRKSQLKK